MEDQKNRRPGVTRRDFLKGVAVVTATAGGVVPAIRMARAEESRTADGTVTFRGEELLGKPTNTSITVNIIPDEKIVYHYQFGTSPGMYPLQTPNATAEGGLPHEIEISGLKPDTRYYYRMRYSVAGTAKEAWAARPEYSFQTQRIAGSTFAFTVISDSHAKYNEQYRTAVQQIIADRPDFHFDLGDTFMVDNTKNQAQVDKAYLAQRNPLYIGGIGHSAPIFLASGNHENEEGWNFDDDPFSIALASIRARKRFYPTPVPNGFYSGNDDLLEAVAIDGDAYRENYYSWEWGDALFVVIDPYQYTMENPYGSMAREGSDDPATGDRWNWTLGLKQFKWLKQTLESSSAPYKFVMAHHMVGGSQNYVRGGAVPAHMFEWGGYEADGNTWGFDSRRPGFGGVPIHQLMKDNNVSAFIHGHDHQYAYEVRDGIVYQSMPRPSTGIDFQLYRESDPYTERVLGNPGYLRVEVSPEKCIAEYVRSNLQEVSHTYTIRPNDRKTA
jgi:predicted phosphodiesterase